MYRFECFCGNERPHHTSSADEGDCRETCSGDSSQICGGNWRLSVYETGIEGDIPKIIKFFALFYSEIVLLKQQYFLFPQ